MIKNLYLLKKPQVISMLFLGFSSGMPYLLIFTTLGLWLNESGVDKSNITYFSFAALGYSFKFVWAPLVDKLPLPILNNLLGKRRSWMLLSQITIIIAILMMSYVNPQTNLELMAYGAVILGFAAATQDITIDAYRIECDDNKYQPILSAAYVMGYRIGLLMAGAGALFIASSLGTTKLNYSLDAWSKTYQIMALIMLIGVITTLIISKPKFEKISKFNLSSNNYLKFLLLFIVIILSLIFGFRVSSDIANILIEYINSIFNNSHLSNFIVGFLRLIFALTLSFSMAFLLIKTNIVNYFIFKQTYISPVADFFNRYTLKIALLLLLVIGFYRISDITLGVVANIFYQDIGFTKDDIATVSKIFGLIMTILGGFIGGFLAPKFGVFKILFLGAILSSATNLLFVALSYLGNNIFMFYTTIMMDNLAGGLAIAAFVAFLSSLTNIEFSATQYAIFSSLMTLFPKIFGGYSGTIVESFGYSNFFIITTIIGLPVLYLVWKTKKYIT